jgi:hypothetical protein
MADPYSHSTSGEKSTSRRISLDESRQKSAEELRQLASDAFPEDVLNNDTLAKPSWLQKIGSVFKTKK